jgi:peptide/nickel transport system permease protein
MAVDAKATVGVPSGETSIRGQSEFQIVMHNLVGNKGAVIGFVLMALLVISALLAPVLAPYDPLEISILDRLQPPSAEHLLGTDQIGRDILSRILYGGRLSLVLGFVSVGIGGVIGTVVGLIAGYYEGAIDQLIMRFVDMLMAMPRTLLALVISFALGPSLFNLMVAVGVGQAPTYIRLVRGSVLSAKRELYVDAARSMGCSNARIMFRHILPNVIGPAVVVSTLALGWAVLSAATLSFLGMGVQPPTPEWGNMVSEGRQRMSVAWWVAFFPGLFIMISVLSLNLLGDGLRDALDPKLRAR